MIITLNGDEGSGKSTVGKRIAEKIGYNLYYTGQIFRDLARKRNLTLVEYLKLGETDPTIDKEVDDYVIALSKKENNFIIDSRMAWHFIPKSLKIYLAVDQAVGAKRIYLSLQEENNRNEINDEITLEKVIDKIKERRSTDNRRYMMYYGVDIHDPNNYDFVIDTTDLNREQVFEKVAQIIKENI